MAKVKERQSKETYRQCTMTSESRQYVAWIPTKLARVGKHVIIDGVPGLWLVVEAGEARPAYIVEGYAENARKGYPSVPASE